MDAGKPCPLGKQPGRSDSKCFPPILGRKASRSSFLRNGPNSRNGALPGGQSRDIPSPAARRPGWAAASSALGFPAAPRHAPASLLSLPGCFATLPAQGLRPGSARPAVKSRWQAARLPCSASPIPHPLSAGSCSEGCSEETPGVAGRERSCARPPGSCPQRQEWGEQREGQLSSPQRHKEVASTGVLVSGSKGGEGTTPDQSSTRSGGQDVSPASPSVPSWEVTAVGQGCWGHQLRGAGAAPGRVR